MIFHSILWVNWSWISCIPLVTCTIYRFATQENFLKESPKKYYTDEIFRLLLVPSMIYYIVDTLVLVIQVPSSWCSISFLVHHIITLSGTKTMMTLPHYPWFIMGPFAMHTFLIMFPQYTFLNYVYLLIIFFCFRGLLQEPWKNLKEYLWELIICVSLVCGPLVMLWYNGCKNDLGNTSS